MNTTGRSKAWRVIVARLLVVLGVIVLAVALLAGYLRWQAFDEETFQDTSSELIANDAVRNQIAATIVEQLFENVDVQAALAERLPPDQQRLAGPAAAGLRELADRIAVKSLERPRVQALWRVSVAQAHAQLLALLRDETTVIRVGDGAVVLDLRPLVVRLGERIAVVGDLESSLPEDAGAIEIMDADQLERAQDLTSLFETVAAWIWLIPLALWAAAIWLARGRRRVELRAIAIGIVVAGLLVLVARSLIGNYVVDELATTTSVKQAAAAAWDIVSDLLADGAWTAIGVGLIALLGVWLAGATTSGTAARRWLAPALVRRELAYGVVAVLFLLVVWWGPTAQTHRPLFLLVAAVLLIAGIEALRALAVREFPEAATTPPREMLGSLSRLRGGAAASGETQVDQLERLARLREQGILSDEELADAKARVLGA